MARPENQRHNSPTLELRSWLDNCLIPALAQEYLFQLEREHITCNGAAGSAESGAESPAKIEAEGGTI